MSDNPPFLIDVADYVERITSWHRGKPQFTATVTALCAPAVELLNFSNALTYAFDLDDAIGIQLDKIGEWIGRSRDILADLDVHFFSWDTFGLGWQEGYWQGAFDPTTGMVKLDDATYRNVLYAKVASNNWDGTLDGMAAIFAAFFPSDTGTNVVIVDNQNMTVDVGLTGAIPGNLFSSILANDYVPFKPVGVDVNVLVVTVFGAPIFGFGMETDSISGFGVGAWGQPLGTVKYVPTAWDTGSTAWDAGASTWD